MNEMIRIKLAFRSLLKNKTFSIITIGSFGVSIAILILLTSFIVSEFSYDSHLKDVESIFRLQKKDNSLVPEQSKELLLDQLPEIELIMNYMINSEPLVFDGSNYKAETIHTDESFFSIFPIQFIAGSPYQIFDNQKHAIITESLAKRIFGEVDPIGKIITVSHKEDLIIKAIIEDFPEKSTLSGELICSKDLRILSSYSCHDNDCTYYCNAIVKLHSGDNYQSINKKISNVINENIDDEREQGKYLLTPYKNIYFDTSIRDGLKHANIQLIKLIGWLSIILLLLSVFNYINLSIAQNTGRLGEFGVKKTLGASRSNIISQFVFESFLKIIISTLLAVVLASLLYPLFSELFGKAFNHMEFLFSWKLCLAFVIFLIMLSIVTATYPALMATSLQPKNLIINNTNSLSGALKIRRSLNILQFVASIIVLISLITINRQIDFVKATKLGFNSEQLVNIPIHYKAADKAHILKNVIKDIPGVKEACVSHGIPGSIRNMSANQEFGSIDVLSSDYSFVPTFELNIIKGRNMFEDEKERVCLINESAFKKTGWDSFENKTLFSAKVVGVIEDIHFKDLYHSISPLMITNGKSVSNVTIRLYPQNLSQTIEDIEKAFNNLLPDHGFSFQFYDDYLDAMYRQEEERARAIQIMTIVTIFISCIGLIGLVEFTTKKRIKEIGIRKVNGARIYEILTMLNKGIIVWILIAFVVACPIAWYVMNQWLQKFAYKTELSWWIFPLAGLITVGFALVAVSWQSWKAATRNPVEALRYE